MKAGWKTRPVGDVCHIVGGGTPSRANTTYFGGRIPWATVRDMKSDWIETTEFSITSEGLKNSAANVLPAGTVIVASRVGLGKVCRARFDTAINQDLRGFIPKDTNALDRQYLFHWFRNAADKIIAAGTGATVQGVTLPFLRSLEIPLPPLEEQRRIVAVLDEAFAAIATAIANAEKNLANAQELFASELDALIADAQTIFPAGPLIDHCIGITVGHVGPMKDRYKPDGIPFLRSQNVRPFEISFEGMMFIDEQFDGELVKSRLRPGDVAVVRTGYPGTAAVIPETLQAANCSDIVIIRPGKQLNPHFVAAFLNSNIGKRAVSGELVGAAQKHFNVGSAKNVVIPLPPLPQQSALVSRVVAFSEQAEKLVTSYQLRLQQLADLKGAILRSAFAGELSASTLELVPA